jgi:hypothetical protein
LTKLNRMLWQQNRALYALPKRKGHKHGWSLYLGPSQAPTVQPGVTRALPTLRDYQQTERTTSRRDHMLTWPSMSHDDQRAQLLTCQGQRPKSKPKTWQTNPTKEQHNRLCTSCGVESTHKAHSAAHRGKPPDMSAGRGIPKRQCTTQAQSKDNYGSTMRDAPSQQALGMVLPLCCFKMNGAPKSHNWQRHGGTAVHMCARHFYMRSLNSPSQQTPTHTRPTEKQRQKLPSVHAGSVGKAIPHGASCGLTL